MKIYNIEEFSKLVGITQHTLRTYDKINKFKPAFVTKGGHRRYTEEQLIEYYNLRKENNNNPKFNIGYVRVSSKKQIDDLKRQKELMELFLIKQGKPFEIIESIGSGINYKNDKLQHLINRVATGNIEEVFVLHKDRLVRFGFDLIEYLFSIFKTKLTVINNNVETKEEELVKDLVQIITVFSCKLNGKRKYKIDKFTKELKENDE